MKTVFGMTEVEGVAVDALVHQAELFRAAGLEPQVVVLPPFFMPELRHLATPAGNFRVVRDDRSFGAVAALAVVWHDEKTGGEITLRCVGDGGFVATDAERASAGSTADEAMAGLGWRAPFHGEWVDMDPAGSVPMGRYLVLREGAVQP